MTSRSRRKRPTTRPSTPASTRPEARRRRRAAVCAAALLSLAVPSFGAEPAEGRGAAMLKALRDRDAGAAWDATEGVLPPEPTLQPVVEPLFTPTPGPDAAPEAPEWRASRAAAGRSAHAGATARLAQRTNDPPGPTPATDRPGTLGNDPRDSRRADPGGPLGADPRDPLADPLVPPVTPRGDGLGDTPRIDPAGPLGPRGADPGDPFDGSPSDPLGGRTPSEEPADGSRGESGGGRGDLGGDARGSLGEDIAPGTDEDKPVARSPGQLRRIGEILPYYDYGPDPDVDDPCLNLCPRPDGLPCKQYAEGEMVPACPEEVGLGDDPFVPRSIAPSVFAWKASNVHYNPLYFEDVPLERYGHTYGDCVQPFVSLGKFGVQLVGLPYQMALDPPHKKVYPLGYYRPGEPAPKLFYQIPLNARAAAVTAGFYSGLGVILP